MVVFRRDAAVGDLELGGHGKTAVHGKRAADSAVQRRQQIGGEDILRDRGHEQVGFHAENAPAIGGGPGFRHHLSGRSTVLVQYHAQDIKRLDRQQPGLE